MLYLEIFNRNYINRFPVTGVNIPRDLDFLRRTYEYNKDVIVEYYKARNFSVKNTNLISRMLDHLPLMLETDLYDFLTVSEDRFEYLCETFGITNGISKGIVHPPYFYGNRGDEIIIGNSKWTSPTKVVNNWEDINAIQTVTHCRNDLKLLVPAGLDDGSKSGLSTVAIDGVILNIKYREFIKLQQKRVEEGYTGAILNKNQFVAKYVLPGIMESHIDHIFLNRVMDTFYGNEIVTPKFKSRVILREPKLQVDRFCNDIVDYISNKNMDFVNILNNIPLMFTPNASLLLSYLHMPNTRQSNWAFIASRLKYMCFVYDIARNKGVSKNFIEDWKRLVTRLKNDKGMLGEFSHTVTKEIEEYIYKISNM